MPMLSKLIITKLKGLINVIINPKKNIRYYITTKNSPQF
ncbi:hypothetical protein EJK51_0904 [Moraxella catarrhalis]|uniref:Uncharacterized protein n=1 Tax=Moraxella catarrhalis TaxID=480 RepID=A0A3Q9GCV4_MORCA|nr:hypothetical protein MCR_0859 [Moraxella catarrhalis BBH18]AZQ88275.1 hypothetical protein EJK52_0906 [Moraxella catarrhalis]EKF83484.1 hypothetical protein MCRH_0941 [Moraxella catarrhalis RH4]AZQ90271.1 hypothetical protein EJK50_0962 [Moraxella catarrhalis]AZQ91729.1 hypothetical protein EJK51_0904 [Moraxella catarrhalis]